MPNLAVVSNDPGRPAPLGQLVDKLEALREKKRKKTEELKAIETEFTVLEINIMDRLSEAGIDACRGKKATVSISLSVVPNIVDFDLFAAYVKKTGYFHLFQRRLSAPAYRELADQLALKKKSVPGLESFTKTALNLRSL